MLCCFYVLESFRIASKALTACLGQLAEDTAITAQGEQLVRPNSSPLPVSDHAQPPSDAQQDPSAASLGAVPPSLADVAIWADALPAVESRSEARLKRWSTADQGSEAAQAAGGHISSSRLQCLPTAQVQVRLQALCRVLFVCCLS